MSDDNKRNALFDRLLKKNKAEPAPETEPQELATRDLPQDESEDELAGWFSDTAGDPADEDDLSDTIAALFGSEDEEVSAEFDDSFIDYSAEQEAVPEESAGFEYIPEDEPSDEAPEEYAEEYPEEYPEEQDSSAEEDALSEADNAFIADADKYEFYGFDEDIPSMEPIEYSEEADAGFEPEPDGVSDFESESDFEAEPEEELYEEEDGAEEHTVDEDTANLFRALGYDGAGAGPVKKPAKRPEEPVRARASDLASAFAYNGREYTDRSQIAEIKDSYSKERKLVIVRLAATMLFAVLLFIYDIGGKSFGGALDAEVYPVINIMMSLQLLLFAAVFSVKQLWSGLNGIFKSSPVFHSLSAAAVALTVIYDIILAIAAPESFTVYNSPAALCLLFTVGYDYFVLQRETDTFDRISSWNGIATLERVDADSLSEELGEARVGATGDKVGNAFRIKRGDFAVNYFRRINRPHPSAKMINYLMIVPVIALAFVFALVAVAAKCSFIEVCNIFITVVQICLPSAMLITMAYPFFALVSKHLGADSIVFGEADVSEHKRVDTVVFDESDLFDENTLSVNRISVFDKSRMDDVFDILCAIYGFYDSIGGKIANAFKRSIDDVVVPEGIKIISIADGGFEGVSGEHRYTVGSDAYLTSLGIPVMRYYDDKYIASNPGGVVLHVALDGAEIFKLYLTYRIPDNMLSLINELPENNIRIVMRTVDPNITLELISRLLTSGFNGDLTLVRKPYTAGEKKPEQVSPLEGGILVNGEDPEAIIDVVKSCKVFNTFTKLNFKLSMLIYALGALLCVFLGVIGALVGLSPLYVILFQIISALPCFVLVHLILSK